MATTDRQKLIDELERLETVLEANGGRGVDVANRIDELRRELYPDVQEEPYYCPFCGSTSIVKSMALWFVRSIEDPGNTCTAMDHQCQSCGYSFWG